METHEKEILYRAMLARDRRYDGRFYVGVHTTGIYCRPICPARPRLENVSFYRSQAEAEGAGFRPCLRCRPDLSPTSRQWQGTAAVVGRALTLIAAGEADETPLEHVAERLGISDRHLRRLFDEHLGASPIEVATSKRLHLAKQLLLQTRLPVTEVAMAAGFQSIRRFNAAFLERFRQSPSAMRRQDAVTANPELIQLELPYLEPFDWDFLVHFLRRHQVQGIERFDAGTYHRLFSVDGQPGWVRVANNGAGNRLELRIASPDVKLLRGIIERVRGLFDLRMNPYQLTACEDGFMQRHQGMRIPGCWDPFETAVTIILGQLISVEAAGRYAAHLVERFGQPLPLPPAPGLTHLFPLPEVLAEADLTVLGLPRVRAAAISSLARHVADRHIDLSRACDLAETRAKLLSIKGIGPWTVEMIAMRCLSDTDAFPRDDLIVRRALELHGLDAPRHAPYRAYLALAIWKEFAASLSKKRTRPEPERRHDDP